MSINQAHYQGGLLLYQGEQFVKSFIYVFFFFHQSILELSIIPKM
jgi:hypothetical protein